MGQQQLLLVILVTILVGIATVVAINTFGTSAAQANEDAIRNDLATIASGAQQFYIRPTLLGGGGNAYNATDNSLTLDKVPGFSYSTLSEDGLTATNLNATYVLNVTGANGFTVTATPSHPDNTQDIVLTVTDGNQWSVAIASGS